MWKVLVHILGRVTLKFLIDQDDYAKVTVRKQQEVPPLSSLLSPQLSVMVQQQEWALNTLTIEKCQL